MEHKEFIKTIKKILNRNIKFEGHIAKIINNIDDKKAKNIINWIKDCRDNKEKYEPCKNYIELIAFIYKSNDNEIRGILSKKKNKYFIELFLDKHKYYDRKRKYLGI